MRAFEYTSPRTADDAVRMLSSEGAVALAGGTDLLSLMKDGAAAPSRLVNLKAIPDLTGAHEADGGLHIGATTRLGPLGEHRAIRESFPAVAEAIAGVRSRQVLSIRTVGGDLCQRPRCWYFRAGFGLVPMHDGESMAKTGDNRYHAIFGNAGAAVFVNPSSLAPPLIALGASATVLGPDGERTIALEDLYRTPMSSDESEFTLGAAEIVTGVTIPMRASKNATYDVRNRKGFDWPLATASVAMGDGGTRVVLGHVAPTPWTSAAAAGALAGGISEASAQAAGDAAVADASALSGNAYKIQLSRVAVKRAALAAM
jgi:xanthine dehydrogenase YagS FAD-binding subunit